MFLCKTACRLIFELLYLLPLEIVLPMRIDSIGRIRPAFMPGHIVHPRFIAMRLLRGGGERVAEVIKPKFGREMLFESAFEKKERNGKSSFDFVEIGKKGGMERDSAGFGFFPFFLFGGLNGNKAAFVKGEGEHLARAHTRKNQKPKAKLCAGLRLFCEKSADKFAWNDLSGGALVRLDLYLRHDVNG